MDWLSRNKAWLAGVLLASFALTIRFLAVNQTGYASGWDGYYYVMQVHSWITLGHLQSPDFSPVYPFLSFISLFTNDYVLAFKIGQALLSALLILSAYCYVLKTSGSASYALLTGAYLTFSPTLIYLGVQFPKNVMGLIFLVWFLYFILRKQLLYAGLFLIFAFLTHRMIGGLCVLIVLFNGARQLSWKYIAGVLAVLLILSFLPGVLHVSDLARFSGEFSWLPQLSTFSFYQLFRISLSQAWIADLILLTASVIFICYASFLDRREQNMEWWTWVMLIFIALFPFFVVTSGSIGFRFLFVAPVFLAIPAISRLKLKEAYGWGFGIVLLGLSLVSYGSYKPSNYDPPNQLYEKITARIAAKYRVADYPLVIAHNGLAEMIIFKTDFDALNWAPPNDMDPNRILRIVHNLEERHIARVMGKDRSEFQPVGPLYYTSSEAMWMRLLEVLKVEKLEDINARIIRGKNPMQQRPYYLTKGKDL